MTKGKLSTKKARRAGAFSKALMIFIFVALVLYTLSLFLPILWSVMTSLKSRGDFSENPLGLPTKWMFSNYAQVFSKFTVKVGSDYVTMPFMILYSLLYALGCSFFSTVAHCITAYAVARFNFKLSKVIYGAVIVCMILPIVGALPSELSMARRLKIYDTFIGVWFMKAHFLGMYFLVFHATFKALPKEFHEAAAVDGASNFRVLWSIVLPLVKLTFFVIMLIHFIGFWNDYQTPMLYLPSYPTLAFGLYLFEFSSDNKLSTVPMKLAGCMIVLVPIMVLFLIFHDRLIGNISMGGVKE